MVKRPFGTRSAWPRSYPEVHGGERVEGLVAYHRLRDVACERSRELVDHAPDLGMTLRFPAGQELVQLVATGAVHAFTDVGPRLGQTEPAVLCRDERPRAQACERVREERIVGSILWTEAARR